MSIVSVNSIFAIGECGLETSHFYTERNLTTAIYQRLGIFSHDTYIHHHSGSIIYYSGYRGGLEFTN